MKKIVREKLNEIKRNNKRLSAIGVGGMYELRDDILKILTDHGCTWSEQRFEFISEKSIIVQFNWMAKIFESPEELVAQVDLDDADDSAAMIREIKDIMLKRDDVLAVHRKSWNDVDSEWGKIERADIMANMLVAVVSEKFEGSETEEFVLINRRMLKLSNDVNESPTTNMTDNAIFEIKRGGSERESMGVGYVGMIKNILSEVQIEHYNRGADRTTQDDEDSERINVMVQEIFSCESKDIDVVDLGEGPDATDVINRIRRYIYDENEVKGFSAWGVTYQIRWGKYFAVIVERSDVPGQESDPPYFHIALDNRHIRLY